MLRSVEWEFHSDVLGQAIGPLFKGKAAHEALKMRPLGCSKTPVTTNLRCVTSQKSEDIIGIDAVTPPVHDKLFSSFNL